MLAVAAHRDRTAPGSPAEEERKAKRVWVHGLGESTGLPAASVDLYVLSFVVHELPQQVGAIASCPLSLVFPVSCHRLSVPCSASYHAPIIKLHPVAYTIMPKWRATVEAFQSALFSRAFVQCMFTPKSTLWSDTRPSCPGIMLPCVLCVPNSERGLHAAAAAACV